MENIIGQIGDALNLFKKTIIVRTFIKVLDPEDSMYRWDYVIDEDIITQGHFIDTTDTLSADDVMGLNYEAFADIKVQGLDLRLNYEIDDGFPDKIYIINEYPYNVVNQFFGVLKLNAYQQNGDLYTYTLGRIQPQYYQQFLGLR